MTIFGVGEGVLDGVFVMVGVIDGVGEKVGVNVLVDKAVGVEGLISIIFAVFTTVDVLVVS